jgi:5S rRNA maturation endonuclease (ribonuclease M5)
MLVVEDADEDKEVDPFGFDEIEIKVREGEKGMISRMTQVEDGMKYTYVIILHDPDTPSQKPLHT